jgi:N-acetylneuraminic acid mutarotase
MTYRSAPIATLALTLLELAACGVDTTQPNLAEGAALRPPKAAMSSGIWITRLGIVPQRDQMAAGTINNIIYVVGGRLSTAPENEAARVDAYNLVTNTWSRVASLPSRVIGPYGASAINGKLYVAGGYRGGNPSRDLFVYTPATNSWVRKRPLPASVLDNPYCEGGAQGVIGGKLYIYVPCGDGYPGGRLLRYNPATDGYAWLPGPPVEHAQGGAGVINGKFYLAAGYGGAATLGQLTRSLHVYDPATNAWTTKARSPEPRFRVASAVLNGKLFLIGGQLQGVDRGDNTLTWYDPGTNTWSKGPPMPTPRFAAAAATASGGVYVIGGSDSTGLRGKNEVYRP